jgi:recombinational DNA repair protein RecR
MSLPEPLSRLIEELQRLPGIGPKGAQRLAFHILKAPAEQAQRLAVALQELLPTGTPIAMRVTRTPSGFSSRASSRASTTC